MKRNEIIKELVLERHSPCFGSFYKLFQHLLEEARSNNDVAPIEEVPKLQGEIRVLKKLLKDLNPSAVKRVHYDGGFGEQ